MPLLPEPISDLIHAFQRLPGIGPKTAARLAFYLLRADSEIPEQLAQAPATLLISRQKYAQATFALACAL